MKRISVVVPCFNEEATLPKLFVELARLAAALPGYALEIVCVNDGSADGTLARLLEGQARFQSGEVVVVDLSRNFGKEAALSAGLRTARGDAVIPFDADLQDPPELIPALVALWEKGNEVVLGAKVSGVEIDAANLHTVSYVKDGQEAKVTCRWVADAFDWKLP